MSEHMVSLTWPNGVVTACRKTIAERMIKKGQCVRTSDIAAQENQREKIANEKAAAKAAAAEKAAAAKAAAEKASAKADKD